MTRKSPTMLRTEQAVGTDLPAPLRSNAAYLIFDIHRLHASIMDRRTARLGLSRSQWWLIAFLIYYDGATQQALADVMDMTKGGLAKLVDKLEEMGIVRRSADAKDARSKRVFLSATGRQMAAHIDHELAEAAIESANALSAAENRQLIQLLTRVREGIIRQEEDIRATEIRRAGS